ncbi:MAG: DUF4340 domain-containing protein [Planctomycetota bacterium]|nr:DUF4340 domain-containing protein [Planctomycetota bacterium]
MNENAKTITFAVVAAVLGLGAYASLPKVGVSEKDVVNSVVGKPLFEKFTDPTVASTLKIVKYDPNQVRIAPFELTRDKKSGAWIIPSHSSYPADAASQVSKVANAFIGLKILSVESTKADDQKLYGVIEPDATKMDAGETAFGTLVRMQDDKGEPLVDLIVGKTVRDDENKRYVRKSGSDAVYVATFDPAPLTTDFSAWIEGDLLKLSANDVETLTIRDYNIIPTQRGGGQLDRDFDATVSYSTKDNKWIADAITVYTEAGDVPRTLTADEQINTAKLNEIKNALDSLKIVDVVRKPQGLAANLKADKQLLDDNEKILSLYNMGFVPVQTESGGLDLLSSSGELAVTLKDGVQYLLRFGKAAENVDMGTDGKVADTTVALNRSLFVTARLDESRYPEPVLKTLPTTIAELDAIEASAKATESPATSDVPEMKDVEFAPAIPDAAKPTDTSKPEAAKPEAAKSDATMPTDAIKTETTEIPKVEPPTLETPTDSPASPPPAEKSPAGGQSNSNVTLPKGRFVALQEEATKTPEVAEAAKEAAKEMAKAAPAEPAATAQPSETAPQTVPEVKADLKAEAQTEVKPEMKADPAQAPAATAAETEQEAKERLEAAREKINKENQRLIDERADKIEAGKKKAAELNARFAEWYYEISDADYKRLRIKLDELIEKKGNPSSPADNAGAAPGFGGGLPFNFPGN